MVHHYFLRRLLQDERGGISAEYVAILALVVIAAISALGSLGDAISNIVNNVSAQLENQLPVDP